MVVFAIARRRVFCWLVKPRHDVQSRLHEPWQTGLDDASRLRGINHD
jgi:hypothetical protein